MAKRKRRAARRRKSRRSMSEPTLSRGRGRKTRRSTRRRKKSGLSEMFSHNGIKTTGTSSLSGALGGGIQYGIDALLGKENKMARIGLGLVSAFILGAGMDKPNMAAGMTGALAYSLIDDVAPLSEMENYNYADPDSLEEYPDALDEEGNAMYLAEDGNFYYLEEFELAEDGNYYLSETMQAQLYPGYVNPNGF